MLTYAHGLLFPNHGLPEGVLTFSNKECLNVGRPSGSPDAPPGGSPSPWVQFLQVDIQTKVRKIQELLEKSDFEKTPRAKEHVFLQRISMRV